jgi:hypothetical protein
MREKVNSASRGIKAKATVLAVVSAALLYVTPYSNAQRPTASAENEMKTNLPGVTTKAAPPDGFKPLTASDEELAKFGFPPRPSQTALPKVYATWAKAVQAAKNHIVPELQKTNISHHPHESKGKGAIDGSFYSSNWSGEVATTSAYNWYSPNAFYYVYSEFEVPLAQQAFGACTGDWDYDLAWVGIDGYSGYGYNDVLQSGIEADAYCYNYYGSYYRNTFYSAWFEWVPDYLVRIPNFPIAPADEVFVEVWSTSPTQGHAYIVNYSTNSYVVVSFNAPYGTYLTGNSAEWIVERPFVNGYLSTLTNYVTDYFSDAYAVDFSYRSYEPGYSTEVDMLDSCGYFISYPVLLGDDAIRFQDANSARFFNPSCH